VAQQTVQFDRRFEIPSKWFFDDDARAVGAPGFTKIVQDRGEHAWRNRKVAEGMAGARQTRTQPCECFRVVVVAIDVTQRRRHTFKRLRIDVGDKIRRTLPCASAQAFEIPARACDADDRYVQTSTLRQRKERWKYLSIRKIAGYAEQYDRVRRFE